MNAHVMFWTQHGPASLQDNPTWQFQLSFLGKRQQKPLRWGSAKPPLSGSLTKNLLIALDLLSPKTLRFPVPQRTVNMICTSLPVKPNKAGVTELQLFGVHLRRHGIAYLEQP